MRRAKLELRKAVERVAQSPALLRSTWADFEGWAKSQPKLAADPDGDGGDE